MKGRAPVSPTSLTQDEILDHLMIEVCTFEGYQDSEAYAFLNTVAEWARVVDDAYDQDKPHIPDAADVTGWTMELMAHPYVKRHPQIEGVLIAALNAWEDSNQWLQVGEPCQGASLLKHYHALVIRDYINEVLPVVAFLVGGRRHMRALSLAIRTQLLKPQDWGQPHPSDPQ